jgi:hypothetical protein
MCSEKNFESVRAMFALGADLITVHPKQHRGSRNIAEGYDQVDQNTFSETLVHNAMTRCRTP